jgi:hypothetical protein
MIRIAVINQPEPDGLARTLIDGSIVLARKGTLEFRLSSRFEYTLDTAPFILSESDFVRYASEADLIILLWSKRGTGADLAGKIGLWGKTVFLDGSEIGKNGRHDSLIRESIIAGTYVGQGRIDEEMLQRCALYFRREKPYIRDIIPLPFGIETRYLSRYDPGKKRDIDFTCIFGQEEYPVLRRQVRECLEAFCKENGFSCATYSTRRRSFFGLFRTKADGHEKFYDILSRSKVGISVGGGGFDTLRFWEILGNGCLLMTETIDIYGEAPGSGASKELDYRRIWQFRDMAEFEDRLGEVAAFLKNGYDSAETHDTAAEEYGRIMETHSSKARVMAILEAAKKKGIIKRQ